MGLSHIIERLLIFNFFKNTWQNLKIIYTRIEFRTKVGEKDLSTVRVGETESVENAIKRFKRKCQKDGIIGDLRKHEQYEKPSVKRKKKQKAAIKRNKKRA